MSIDVLIKNEKVNAPLKNKAIAFSLTKSKECIKSDKPVVALEELCIGRALTRMGHSPELVGVKARTVCNSVAFPQKSDMLSVNNLGKIPGCV